MKTKNFILVFLLLILFSSRVYSYEAKLSEVDIKVVKGNNAVGGSESFTSIINRTKPKAAINANFFDAYKTLEPFGTIIIDNVPVYLQGEAIFRFEDGVAAIEKKKIMLEFYISDEKYLQEDIRKMGYNYLKTFKLWEANIANPNKNSFSIYNKYRKNTPVLKDGRVVTVIDSKIVSASAASGKYTVPDNGYIIFVGNGVMSENDFKERFQKNIGEKIVYRFTADNKPLDNVKYAIGAGPILVENGVNVAAKNKKNFEAKISQNKGARSAIGITWDNKLILHIASGLNVEELANAMIKKGCKSAMNLDGGASSALYVAGKYLRTPGRNLNTVLLVYDKKQQAKNGKNIYADPITVKYIIEGKEYTLTGYAINETMYYRLEDIAACFKTDESKFAPTWNSEHTMVELDKYVLAKNPANKEMKRAAIKEAFTNMKFEDTIKKMKVYIINNETYYNIYDILELRGLDKDIVKKAQ